MVIAADIFSSTFKQMQNPSLAFLIGGMMRAAPGGGLTAPEPVCTFIVMALLLRVGLGAGMSIRHADAFALAVPAVLAMRVGVAIVPIGGGRRRAGRGAPGWTAWPRRLAVAPAVVLAGEIAQGLPHPAPHSLDIIERFYAIPAQRSFPHPPPPVLLEQDFSGPLWSRDRAGRALRGGPGRARRGRLRQRVGPAPVLQKPAPWPKPPP